MDTVDYYRMSFGPVAILDSRGLIREVTGVELTDLARSAAAGLAHHGVRHQDRVVVIVPTGVDYLAVLLGCLFSGVVPVTVAAPVKPGDPASAGVRHLRAAITVLRPAAVITADPAIAAALPTGTPLLTTDDLRRHGQLSWRALRRPEPEQVHHIQLTSGSTSAPKAAVLTHANVASNLAGVHAVMDMAPGRDRVTSWLPMYHDMGLMLMLLGLTAGAALDLTPPTAFVRDPVSWPRHMAERRATITAAPPFAYHLAAERHTTTSGPDLDLSALRQAYMGAEPIAVGVLERFRDTFTPHGLAEDTLLPCYGMAETVAATTLCRDKHATTDTSFGRVRWHRTTRDLVSCGTPVDGLSLRVTTPDGDEAPDGEIGAVHVSGGSVMAGYLTGDGIAAPPGGWHDTGDLGLHREGELYIVGRTKEMLIVRGRNLPPYDIERVVEDHPQVKAGGCAVFSHLAESGTTEQIVAVVETREQADRRAGLRDEITTSVRQVFNLSLADVVFVPRGGIPRTTSGKRRRQAIRDTYLTGHLTT